MGINGLEHLTAEVVPVWITQEVEQLAQGFAAQQHHPPKAAQVYRNTLAVGAVNQYLQVLGIATDLRHCDSWNPMMRSLLNTADLEVVGWGRLECRPISTTEWDSNPLTGLIPTEVQRDRVGYVFVHLDEPEATLLGFTPTLAGMADPVAEPLAERFALNALQPFSQLLSVLDQHLNPGLTPAAITVLSHWFDDIITSGWQALDSLLGSATHPVAYRQLPVKALPDSNRTMSRGKVLSSFSLAGVSIALVVNLTNLSEAKFEINLRLHSLSLHDTLPSDLRARLVDLDDTLLMVANNQDGHRLIELCFEAEVGDRFNLILNCWEEEVIEQFEV